LSLSQKFKKNFSLVAYYAARKIEAHPVSEFRPKPRYVELYVTVVGQLTIRFLRVTARAKRVLAIVILSVRPSVC